MGVDISGKWVLAGIIVVVAIAAFVNSLGGQFVWDDRMLILKDPAVRAFHGMKDIKDVVSSDFFERSESPIPYGYYRPVTTVSYIIDRKLWGPKPFGFHVTNVAFHALASVLGFLLMLDLGLNRGQAAAVAILFAVHPVHTENVAWIAGRTDVLAFVLGVGAVVVHLAARPAHPGDERASKAGLGGVAGEGRRLNRVGLDVLAAALFGMSLLAKEMAAIIPTWIFLIHMLRRREGWRRSLRTSIPFLGVLAGYLVLRFVIVDVPPPRSVPGAGMVAALVTMPATVLRYLGWLASPNSPGAYVQNPYVRTVGDLRFWGALLVLLGATFGVVKLSQRDRRIGLLAGMFAVSLIPILNVIRVASPADMGDTMAARFCYLPSLPFLALCIVVVSERNWMRPALGVVLVVGLAAADFAATWRRNHDWHDEETLFSKTVTQVPNAALPLVRLGFAELRHGRIDAASRAIARAASVAPRSPIVLDAQVNLLVMRGRFWQALPLQERLVDVAGRARAVQLGNLAYLERVTGHVERARRILEKLIAAGHANSETWFNLAEVHRAEGEVEAARAAYARAIARDPHHRLKLLRAASFEQHLGHFTQAEKLYARVVGQYPRSVRARLGLADVLAREGKRDAALEQLGALRRSVHDPRVRAAVTSRLDMLERRRADGRHHR